MASEIKVNKISPGSGTALQISDSGDTVTLPSGATLTIAGTINASTGTATGFGDNLSWQTSDIKTSTFTAAAEKGDFVNTTAGAITVNLPAGSAGAQIGLLDYAGTWDSNNVTLAANGSEKIQGSTTDATLSRDREAIQVVYVDSTQGWLITSVSDQAAAQVAYTSATGGTITTSGDYKIHKFTSSGNFVVSSVGNAAGGGAGASYVVVAGGASGSGTFRGGGGGAGGYREGKNSGDPYTASPLNAPAGLTLTATTYPITVGAGGAGAQAGPGASGGGGNNGANSVFSTITSTGGGRGGIYNGQSPTYQPIAFDNLPKGFPGGSGGGGAGYNPSPDNAGGIGNTPPVSPSQGNNGGAGSQTSVQSGGGGGGAGAVGAGGANPGNPGGAGVTSSITASPTAYGGGGGGGGYDSGGPGCGGSSIGGSGGCGSGSAPGNDAAANTGSGGGGAGGGPDNAAGGSGGSGVVIIRYKYQN